MKIRVEKIVKHQAPCTLSFQVQDQDQAQVYNFWNISHYLFKKT